MVCASYCAPCPKWLYIKHEANICCIMSLCSRTFYFLLLSLVINIMTIPLNVTDVTVWPITSNSNPIVLKIEKYWKKNKIRKKMKKKLSLYSLILIFSVSTLSTSNYSCMNSHMTRIRFFGSYSSLKVVKLWNSSKIYSKKSLV